MARYFGTNGVRGRIDELTPELARRLSQATGAYFKGGKMLLARDCRLTGEVLHDAAVAGLASAGCDVMDIGIASSPTAEFMVKKLKADGCVIITASHNPPEWNGLKVVDASGVAVSKERGEDIEALLDKPAGGGKAGKVTRHESATDEHIGEIVRHVRTGRIKKKKPKIVIDCGNGTAALIAPKLLKCLGCVILSLNSHMDGRFPGRPSEPSEANVKDLIALVKSSNADAGIAWDGDGDRVIFVDERGGYVIGDKVYALSILWKAARLKTQNSKPAGDVVTTVATSKAVEDVAKTLNLKTRYTAIGAPYLSEEVARGGAFMGGEEVGGVIWPESSLAKDGFLTAAKLAEALCEKPLSEWLKEVPVYFNVKIKLEADAKAKEEMVARVKAETRKRKLKTIEVDGVRVNFKDSWVIVRASGTENYVRIFAEAKSEAEAKRLVQEYGGIARG
ncbi:phosphoglucosamine mutase [Candidatus Micrarchaeota archaeon]|nr:phosphoglucosamine mutase [Candidatus Micrarchaeota archaeon]